VIFSGSHFALYLYFGKVKKAIDPFDLYFLSPLKPLYVDENGFLRFTLLLHAFEITNQTSFYFKTSNPSIIKYSSLTCDNLEFKKLDEKIFITSNIPIGKYILNSKILVNTFKGSFEEICVHTIMNDKLTAQLTIFIDEKEVSYQKMVDIEYSIKNIEFVKSASPGIYYYDDYKYYILNFLCDKTFSIIIDSSF
jgi:hypothetical protein